MNTVAHQIISALRHLHSLSLPYGKLTLSNVLVRKLNPLTVALSAFPLAVASTPTAVAVGHPGWIPPEYYPSLPAKGFDATMPLNAAADVYQFGCLLHQLFAGGVDPWAFSSNVATLRLKVGIAKSPLLVAADVGRQVSYTDEQPGKWARLLPHAQRCLEFPSRRATVGQLSSTFSSARHVPAFP